MVCADDLPWLLEALGPRVVASTAARRAALGLDARTLARAREVAQRRLAGGHAFTREQMLAAFAAAGIAVNSQRGYHILFNLSLTGTLCSGPPTTKDPTFALLSEWVKKPRRLEHDQALGELARRYVESHGPAKLSDLVGWAKLTASDAKRGVEVAGRALTSIDVHGVRYLLAAGAQDGFAAVEAKIASSVLALPGFDEFVLGYKDREAILDPAFADRLVPGGNGVFRPTIVVGGHVEGVWRKKKSAKAMVIEAEPFTKLSKTVMRGFASAAAAYGRFLGTPVRVARPTDSAAQSRHCTENKPGRERRR